MKGEEEGVHNYITQFSSEKNGKELTYTRKAVYSNVKHTLRLNSLKDFIFQRYRFKRTLRTTIVT